MKDKLIKAYTAAWKWPQVYTAAPSVIWTSRAIAILVPVSLIALTIITGVPLFGVIVTGVMAALLGFVIVAVTVKIFYPEHATVEDFTSRETRIKEFFHGFPAITPIPLIELEEGVWVAYGHVDPLAFVDAVMLVILHVTDDPARAVEVGSLASSVGHLYAQFKNPEESHWEDGLELCKLTAENCFPITRLEI